jgi:predicted TIM-barrel fold metal-dependent hydrolase
MPGEKDSSSGKPSGPYRRGKLLRSVVPYAKAARNLARPGPRLRQYEPVSNLVADENLPVRALHPAVDFHTHLGRWLSSDGDWMERDKSRLLQTMDSLNIAMLVNLDGRWGDDLEDNLDRYDRAHPDRFATFCQVDLEVLGGGGGPDTIVKSLESSKVAGAKGLKIWKNLGLFVNVAGRRLMPDDELLAPMWEAAGALGLPVLVHVADPVAFFQPMDRHNERLEELMAHPSISLAGHGIAVRERIIASFEAAVARHTKTQFIGAHVGCNAENLPWVSRMLSEYPNFWIDTAARSELGRQPRASARMIGEHADRVLFGTDVFPIDPDAYRVFFRLLETEDEYFGYTPGNGPSVQQGRWTVSGLGLGSELIEKVYRLNALRLLGLESTDVVGAGKKATEAAES